MKVNLAHVAKVHIRYYPYHQNAALMRELMKRVSSKAARATNQKCQIKCEVESTPQEPELLIEYGDGSKLHLQKAVPGIKLKDILEEISRKKEQIQMTAAQPAEKLEWKTTAFSAEYMNALDDPKWNKKPQGPVPPEVLDIMETLTTMSEFKGESPPKEIS
eukprot:m.338477 g.338477  ORF g.338477 m.338477 type:complete len:161 (+) comp18431_c0_seq1:167-649(+)